MVDYVAIVITSFPTSAIGVIVLLNYSVKVVADFPDRELDLELNKKRVFLPCKFISPK